MFFLLLELFIQKISHVFLLITTILIYVLLFNYKIPNKVTTMETDSTLEDVPIMGQVSVVTFL